MLFICKGSKVIGSAEFAQSPKLIPHVPPYETAPCTCPVFLVWHSFVLPHFRVEYTSEGASCKLHLGL